LALPLELPRDMPQSWLALALDFSCAKLSPLLHLFPGFVATFLFLPLRFSRTNLAP
jgi:hypothetical protein